MTETILLAVVAGLVVITLPGLYLMYRSIGDANDRDKRIDELEKARAEDRAEIIRMHTELARVGIRFEQWMAYARQLVSIMEEQGLHVPLSPDEIAEQASQASFKVKPEDAAYNKQSLLRRMERAFNLDELSAMAFQLDVQTGDLGGDTFSAKAMALITHMERRGRLAELVALCRQLRPEGKF